MPWTRVRTLPRLSIRTLFVVVALFAALTGVAISYQQHQHARHIDSADRIASAVLAAERRAPAGTAGALNWEIPNLQLSTRPTYLLATVEFKNGDAADVFEVNLLSDIAAGASTDVVIRYAGNDTVMYYKAIGWSEECRGCHPKNTTGAGDMIAVMKIAP